MSIQWKKLAEPFPENAVEWRVGSVAEDATWCKVLCYIQNRAIMQRLDEVCGPENWRNEFVFVSGGVLCGISIRVDGEWVTKWDGANPSDVEPFKGGLSDAMKRAGVQWGIGRYLYDLEEGWANVVEKGVKGAHYASTKSKKVFYWLPPELPKWALPAPEEKRNYAAEFADRCTRIKYAGKKSELCAALLDKERSSVVASDYADALKLSAEEWKRAIEALTAQNDLDRNLVAEAQENVKKLAEKAEAA